MRGRWPGRLVYWLAVTLVTAGLAHLGSVLALPYRSPTDAYGMLAKAAGGATLKTITASAATLARPFRDAAMAEAYCLYNLRDGPVTASLDVATADFALISVHGRHGRVLYGLTNRSSTQNRLTLTIVTADQATHRPPPADGAAPEIRVEADEPEGFVLAQWFVPAPSASNAAQAAVARLACHAVKS